MAHSEETHTKYYHTKRSQHLVEIGAAALAEDTSQKLGFKCRNKTASADDIPCVDQIVALVSGTSNIQKPEIWLAKVMEVDCETKRAVLAELVEDEANCYKFKIGSKYTEPFSSLIFPVDVCYDESHNLYHHFLPLLLLLFRHATRCYQAPNLQSHPTSESHLL